MSFIGSPFRHFINLCIILFFLSLFSDSVTLWGYQNVKCDSNIVFNIMFKLLTQMFQFVAAPWGQALCLPGKNTVQNSQILTSLQQKGHKPIVTGRQRNQNPKIQADTFKRIPNKCFVKQILKGLANKRWLTGTPGFKYPPNHKWNEGQRLLKTSNAKVQK